MADQSQTATNKQTESSRCKQGCGFFGNAATGGCCSKCWIDVQKSKEAVASAPEICTKIAEKPVPLPVKVEVNETTDSSTTTPKSSASVVPETAVTETPAVTESAPAPVANAPAKKKKKKKKTSYKNMMASMMKESSNKDTAKIDAIRKVTGGGAFSKIEKI